VVLDGDGDGHGHFFSGVVVPPGQAGSVGRCPGAWNGWAANSRYAGTGTGTGTSEARYSASTTSTSTSTSTPTTTTTQQSKAQSEELQNFTATLHNGEPSLEAQLAAEMGSSGVVSHRQTLWHLLLLLLLLLLQLLRYIASTVSIAHFFPVHSFTTPARGSRRGVSAARPFTGPKPISPLGTLRQPASVKLMSGSDCRSVGRVPGAMPIGEAALPPWGNNFFHLPSPLPLPPPLTTPISPNSRPLSARRQRATGLHRHKVPEVVTESAGGQREDSGRTAGGQREDRGSPQMHGGAGGPRLTLTLTGRGALWLETLLFTVGG
jgi:hypothetical protein